MSNSGEGVRLPKRPVQILSVKDNTTHIVRFLGDYKGHMMHHVPRLGSWPCLGASCPISTHRHRSVWKGFGPAEEFFTELNAWYLCVIEVTEALDESLRGFPMRGQTWLLTHPRPTDKQTPVMGMFLQHDDPAALRPAFDVGPVLERVYRGVKMDLGCANPVPPRIVDEGESDSGPAQLQAERREPPKPATEEQWAQLRKMIGKDPRVGNDGQHTGQRQINGKAAHHG